MLDIMDLYLDPGIFFQKSILDLDLDADVNQKVVMKEVVFDK